MTEQEKAAAYDWLVANEKRWEWQPTRYNGKVVSGFAANGTGFLGYTFEEALKLAMGEQCDA